MQCQRSAQGIIPVLPASRCSFSEPNASHNWTCGSAKATASTALEAAGGVDRKVSAGSVPETQETLCIPALKMK